MSISLGCIYYSLTSFFQNKKTRSLYATILQNEKLIKEMKRILQVFPNGVIIWPWNRDDGDQKCFTNEVFDTKISKIRGDINNLKDIDVRIYDNNSNDNTQEISTNLWQLLEDNQRKLDGRNVIVKRDISIQCRPSSRMFSEENELDNELSERICRIKTLEVEWEGVSSCMHVFIDNSDIVKLENAKTSIKWQKIMFASASHEFRTPLNAIMNSFDFVRDTFETIRQIYIPSQNLSDQEEKKLNHLTNNMVKFTKMGHNSSILLLNLIEDILSLSTMEAGTFKINKTDFLMPSLIDEVFDVFELQCAQKGLVLKHKIDSALKQRVINSDFGRIKQVLLNIISNSLKFTFTGYISLKAEIVTTENKHFIQIEVVDSGIGIKQEQQCRLFKLFGMISESSSLNPNGSGIGLTVSKGYIEALEGTMRLESEFGKGTSVIFTIPIQNYIKAEFLEKFDELISKDWSKFSEDFDEHNSIISVPKTLSSFFPSLPKMPQNKLSS
jgi:signal transduction histidine kinase